MEANYEALKYVVQAKQLLKEMTDFNVRPSEQPFYEIIYLLEQAEEAMLKKSQ